MQDEESIFDATCCNDSNVIFFKPMIPNGGQYSSLLTTYGVTVKPGIEAAFYVDLGVRAISAVEDMKADGSWPAMTYKKCKDYASETPAPRTLDLVSAMKVGHS